MRVPTFLATLALAAMPALAQQSDPAPAGQEPAPAADQADSAGGAAAERPAENGQAAATPLEFRTIVGDKPIEIPEDRLTPAFEEFRATGENPFAADEAAVAEGKALYTRLCQACHLPGGEGRIGPSLRDDQWRHPVLETPAGRFAIIHSGGAGAMQAFHPRMSLDEILKVMAYIDTFRES